MSRLPLKYKSGNDVQEITTAEHNYLAYLAGLELETVSSSHSETALGSLGKTNQSDDILIGGLTNTVYDGNVGDHGTLAITTTTTNIYQQGGSYSEHADFRFPLYQKQTSGQQEIQEFNDADELALGETLAGIIYTNDYPGTYKLGSSAPSSDYTIAIANVMTDTRTTGADIVYNLYQRETISAPTEIDLMAVARGSSSPYNAKTGTYRGLIIMADAQRKETAKGCLDRHLAANTSSNLGIGSYVIRSSTQGAPTETGTWVAKGTATDTRNAIADANYTNTFSGTPVTKNFTGTFAGTYTSTSNRITRTSNISTYTTSTNTSFPSNFTGTYTGPTGITTYQNISTDTRWQTSVAGVSVKVDGTEVATDSDAFATTVSAGGVTYERLDFYSRPSPGTTWYEFRSYTGTADYTGVYAGTKTSTFTNTAFSQQNFTTETTKSFVGYYTNTFSSTFTPTSTGTFVGDTIQNSTANVEVYTLYVRTA